MVWVHTNCGGSQVFLQGFPSNMLGISMSIFISIMTEIAGPLISPLVSVTEGLANQIVALGEYPLVLVSIFILIKDMISAR